MDKVQDYYDKSPAIEWERLEVEARIEFFVTMQYLKKYLKPKSIILDIGGGPGKYAIELTKLGHKVHLVDLSPKNIELAIKETKKEKLTLLSAKAGTATSLPQFSNASVDAIINLGPLYHLLDEKDRKSTINESLRILKPDGLALFGFMSKYAVAYYQLNHNPENILSMSETMQKAIDCEEHIVSDSEPGFTDAFFIEPSRLGDIMSKYPIKKLALVGAEGMVSQNENKIFNCSQQAQKEWLSFILATAETTAAINGSQHILFFGKKT
jgi:S-adenosylmethionine-dependent methyltransferase